MAGRGVALARALRAESWRALEDAHLKGLVRSIGVSNYTARHLDELLGMAALRVPPAVLQSEHHPFFTNAAVRAKCAAHRIAFQAYGPLAAGASGRRAGGSKRGVDDAAVRSIALRTHRTPAQVVLGWAVQRGISVLPKSSRASGIEENAHTAMLPPLDAEAMALLDALDEDEPVYWDPRCVDQLDQYNIYLDRERLQRELGVEACP